MLTVTLKTSDGWQHTLNVSSLVPSINAAYLTNLSLEIDGRPIVSIPLSVENGLGAIVLPTRTEK